MAALAADLGVLRTVGGMTVLRLSRTPRHLALALLTVPGMTGVFQPPHLGFVGNVTAVDHVLCTAASLALAVCIVMIAVGLARGRPDYKWMVGVAPLVAASAFGLTCWWMSLLESPQMAFGVIF
jgi:hypothetical protein